MAKAAQAKMDDPSLSLLDALDIGGFMFNGKKVDQDDISLRQRTNNLCRRIRLEKERISKKDFDHEHDDQRKNKKRMRKSPEVDVEEELDADEQHSSGRTTASIGDNVDQSAPTYEQEMQESKLPEFKPAAVLSSEDLPNISDLGANRTLETPLPAQIDDRNSQIAEKTVASDAEVNGRRQEKRDSFLEQISKLPGIDDLDPFDIMAEDEEIEDLTKLGSMFISK